MRLGLTVSAMSAFLVLVMAAFAYAAISHQLDLRARDSLNEKLDQVEHTLAESSASAADSSSILIIFVIRLSAMTIFRSLFSTPEFPENSY